MVADTAQWMVLFLKAGTTSLDAMLTLIAPRASITSACDRVTVRTFLPRRSLNPLMRPLQNSTCGPSGVTPSNLAW